MPSSRGDGEKGDFNHRLGDFVTRKDEEDQGVLSDF